MNPSRTPAGKVLLIGWDAADWKIIQPLLDSGKMPALAGIVHGGVSGPLASLQPMLSPMLWTSVATGRRAAAHGVHGFEEVDPVSGSVRPASSLSRQVKAVWNILAQTGRTAQVVGWFASHPAESLPHGGVCVSDAFFAGSGQEPVPARAVHPPDLAETFADLRVREEDIDASVVSLFVPRWEEVVRRGDGRLARLRETLAQCFSTHAMATYLLEHAPAADFLAIHFQAIDHVGHHFMPYHPPRLENIGEESFEWYRGVVDGIYQLQDRLLARTLELAGENVTVLIVSDHGFQSGSRRPPHTSIDEEGLTAWHRPSGVLAARGPALRPDELVHGASLLDIAPTILALFGLPAGADMEGRVLREAWREPASLPVVPIPSWEAVPGADGRHPPGIALDPRESAALREQFRTLGYLRDARGEEPTEEAENCRRQNRWNLARALLDGERPHDALPLLEDLYHERPERMDYGLRLAHCQLALGLVPEARATAAEALDGREEQPFAKLVLANVAHRERDFAGSLALLRDALAVEPTLPGLNNQLGLALVRHGAWEEAEAAFRRALELDGDNAYACLGVAHTLLRRRRYAEAADWALAALGLKFDLALAHFTLGGALARLGENVRAASAFEACLRFAPGNLAAHRILSRLYRQTGDTARAGFHREASLRGESRWVAQQRENERLRRGSATRDAARAEVRRRLREKPMPGPSAASTLRRSTIGAGARPSHFVIVSGLPRSGTSLMMQMLAAGGMEVLTDGVRVADTDNARGYYEWEAIKRIAPQAELLDDEALDGKVVKCISMLLPKLPVKHRYKVIFMTRPIHEVAASQQKMVTRLEPGAARLRGKDLEYALQLHRDEIRRWLVTAPHIEAIEIDYPALMQNPQQTVARLIDFLGSARVPNLAAMATEIKSTLYHNR